MIRLTAARGNNIHEAQIRYHARPCPHRPGHLFRPLRQVHCRTAGAGLGTTLGHSPCPALLHPGRRGQGRPHQRRPAELPIFPGGRDVTDIVLNLKGLRIKITATDRSPLSPGQGRGRSQGVRHRTQSGYRDPNGLHIASLDKNGELEMELYVDVGAATSPPNGRASKPTPIPSTPSSWTPSSPPSNG